MRPSSMKRIVCALSILALALISCSSGEPDPTAELIGDWRAVLASPGGDLPFQLHIDRDARSGKLIASAVNGEEKAPFSSVTIEDDKVVLAIDWYDSKIAATLSDDGRRMDGLWRKTVPEGASMLAFWAVKGETYRFRPPGETADPRPAAAGQAGAVASVDGSWGVVFTDTEGTEKALGELEQDGERVTGTFLTPTGDYRFLEGDYRDGRLRLSTFDGAHAFLFHARAQPDGTLEGDFWSRDNYHATWTARRLAPTGAEPAEPPLPDPYELVSLTNDEQTFDFDFPDLDGRPMTMADERFQGKVVLVNIFGSWCPNCNDEAPLLAEWDRRYGDRGLEIVGLAFEVTGDPERDTKLVRKYAERHGIDYPLLLAGVSDKLEAAHALRHLDRVVAYPTNIFIGRDGRVRSIHSGFAGPGTGEHYEKLVAELERLIESLLAEPSPEPAPTTASSPAEKTPPDPTATGE